MEEKERMIRDALLLITAHVLCPLPDVIAGKMFITQNEELEAVQAADSYQSSQNRAAEERGYKKLILLIKPRL
jgi:hypothetical protein